MLHGRLTAAVRGGDVYSMVSFTEKSTPSATILKEYSIFYTSKLELLMCTQRWYVTRG